MAEALAETDRTRTALLAAVSHDLRTPLASANAAITSLAASDVRWTDQERQDLVASAQRSLDRLSRLVENLLDMSRLQAGALSVALQPVAVEDAVASALDEIRAGGEQVWVDVPDTLPSALADQPLLERVLVNLLANALRHSPEGAPVLVTASSLGDRVEIRVVDRGPGIPTRDRDRVFVPFQRLGDTDNARGVGLGLALARGLAEAMDGTLEAEDTPGGGVTMTVTLPATPAADGAPMPAMELQ